MITTVTGKNQVTIPAEVVKHAHIQQGSQLDWSFDGKRRELRVKILLSRGELAHQTRECFRKHVKPGEDLVAELVAEREQDDKEREHCLGIS